MDTTTNYRQGSAEWHKQRIGKFTSSEIHRLLTEPKSSEDKKAGKLSEGALTYVLEKVHEEITGEADAGFDNIATVWGVQNEPLAREWYSKINNVEVLEDGFNEANKHYGGSSDGKVGTIGGIEIKCPYKGAIHLDHCLIESQEYMKKHFKEYYWQCVSNCFINGCEWWDFVSFDPRLDCDAGFFQIRIVPTPEDIDLLCKKLEVATAKKLELLEKFTKDKAA